MRSVSRTPRGQVPRTPARWNWTWLISAAVAAVVLVVALLSYAGSNCRPPTAQNLAAAPAAWQELKPGTNDFWAAGGPLSTTRFTVRITDDQGHQVLIPRILLAPGARIRTRSWMYQTGVTASPAAPSPASASASTPSPTAPARAAPPVTKRTSAAAQGAGCS
ncbi:MAG TPA: hypothetical protein VH641_11095 [Streptosporangiaceae bacterium]|jgi:hypothetical protein